MFYRVKRVALEIHDALTEATQTGRPCQTRLDTHQQVRGAFIRQNRSNRDY